MARLRDKSASKELESHDEFEVYTGQRLENLQRLLDLSGTPSASLHYEIHGKISKRTLTSQHLVDEGSTGSSSAQSATNVADAPSRAAEPMHPIPLPASSPQGKTMYAIASFTKILLNVAYSRVIAAGKYEHYGLSWNRSACDIFNDLRRAKRERLIRRFSRDPTILELLLHRNGFAPMNQYLLAPDGSFIMSKEEFLEAAPLITEDYYKGQKRGFVEYSNANHIFAALILEELTGQPLHRVMEEEVFGPLNMDHTAISDISLNELRAQNCDIATGYRVLGNMSTLQPVPGPLYLRDSVEAAAFGAYSCTDDIAKLIRELLRSLDQPSNVFTTDDTNFIFGPKSDQGDGVKNTLAGLLFDVTSTTAGVESSNRQLYQAEQSFAYTLSPPRHEPHCKVYYKAGTVDGFTCTIYISLQYRAFVIVLANSSGPVDVTEHMAHYTLQEAFDLSPKVDIVQRVVEQRAHNSQQVAAFEDADRRDSSQLGNIRDFEGSYINTRYGQMICIAEDGSVTFGRDKPSSAMRAYCQGNTLHVLPGPKGFGIDRWSVWKNREYVLSTCDGKVALLKSDSGSYFERLNHPQGAPTTDAAIRDPG